MLAAIRDCCIRNDEGGSGRGLFQGILLLCRTKEKHLPAKMFLDICDVSPSPIAVVRIVNVGSVLHILIRPFMSRREDKDGSSELEYKHFHNILALVSLQHIKPTQEMYITFVDLRLTFLNTSITFSYSSAVLLRSDIIRAAAILVLFIFIKIYLSKGCIIFKDLSRFMSAEFCSVWRLCYLYPTSSQDFHVDILNDGIKNYENVEVACSMSKRVWGETYMRK
jgi:hypothetical protein